MNTFAASRPTVNSDGDFFVDIFEDVVVANEGIQFDRKVLHYNPLGELVGMARVPLKDQYTTVEHGLSVGSGKEVYALIIKKDHGEVQRLIFKPDLEPILQPKLEDDSSNSGYARSSSLCPTKIAQVSTAQAYVDNYHLLSDFQMNDNPGCTARTKPRYFLPTATAAWHKSVPYAWNRGDTVEFFNSQMQSNATALAGNINKTSPGCARGIDCSGLVSVASGYLGGKVGTSQLRRDTLLLGGPGYLIQGDILTQVATLGKWIESPCGFW